jgi:uncharacterized membrane protein YdfJ with MMPL/SSD domain
MKPAMWMIALSTLTAAVVAALPGFSQDVEVYLGMLGPLTGAVGTWALVERTYGEHPERLMSLMVAAFGAKVVFFGAYVAVMVKGLSLDPLPFVASFTSYFVGLYAFEAWCLQRLFARGPQAR